MRKNLLTTVRYVTNRVCFLCVIWGIWATTAFSQNAILRGFVADVSDGQALELVNIVLENDEGFYKGTASRTDGIYQLNRIEAGRYTVRASFIGYRSFSDTLSLEPGEFRTLNISLTPAGDVLGELVVEAASEATATVPVAGLQTVRAAELNRMPVPDVSGDLASYLSILPGIVSTGDQGGQLYIRGGEPVQNMVLLDGILLYQPFHILGFYSAFPSDIVSKADIYTGGYGSKYGGRLSAVIDIRSREGDLHSFGGSGAVSPFLTSLLVEGPLIPGRVSVLASFRKSLLNELAQKYVNDDLPFEFSDVFGKVHVELTRTSKVDATYLKTTDQGTLVNDDAGDPSDQIRWNNEAFGARLLLLPRNVAAALEFRVSYSRFNNEIGPVGAPTRTSEIENTHVILEASFFGENLDVNAGFDLRPTALESQLGGLYQNLEISNARIGNWGNYLEMDIRVGPFLHILPSLRAQFYKVRFAPYMEPRLRLIWNRGAHQISAATGLYYQELIGLTDRRDAANIFTAWTNTPSEDDRSSNVNAGRIQKSFHAILGYSFELGPDADVSVEGYYKRLSNLLVAEWTSFPRFTTALQPASGRSAGVDIRFGIQRGPVFAQMNYAYTATRYVAEQASIPVWYGVEGLDFRPPHDRRHQANVLMGASLAGFELSGRWTFGSGFPFSQVVGFDGFAVIEDIADVGRLPTSRRVIYERPFSAVLPDYHRLDLSIEREFEVGPAALAVQASVLNVYNRNNIFYLDVFTLERVNQLPIIPSLGVKLSY